MKKNIKRYTSLLFYVLLFAGILIATYLIVSDARGYEYDLRTGEVNINGLLLLESTPTEADVFVDGETINTQTGDRIELTAESHQIRLTKDGYKPWEKKVRILGERVTDVTYPRLFPESVQTDEVRATNRNRLLPSYDNRKAINYSSNNLEIVVNSTQASLPELARIDLSNSLELTQNNSIQSMKWSADNRYLLVQVKSGNQVDTLYVDSENYEVQNLSDIFSLPLVNVEFDDRNSDDIFWLRDGELRLLDVSSRTVSSPLIENVKSFQQYEQRIAYLERGSVDNKLSLNVARITDEISPQRIAFVEDQAYQLTYRSIQNEDTVLLAAQNQPLRIYSIGSELIPSERVIQFTTQKLHSDYKRSQYIIAQNKNKFFTLNPSSGESYQFSLPYETISSLRWLDNSYVSAVADGQAILFEFDGKNPAEIVQTDGAVMRNENFFELYSIHDGILQKSRLRLEEDTSLF